MITRSIGLHSSAIALMLTAVTSPARSDDVITTHRLSAALAAEAVTEAVASCAKQGYRVSAAVVDLDGLTQAMLRGDGAHAASFDLASDKAYTVVTLGATHNEDSISTIVRRMGANPTAFWGLANAGGLGKLPRVSLIVGGLRIKVGNEVIGGIGVSGGPGIDDDENCAKAGIDKISARLK
jgi:uncharacterized protein GlcG (DUF336 family)